MVDSDLVRTLADLLEETGLAEIEYAKGDLRIRVARPVGHVIAAAAPAPAPVSVAEETVFQENQAGALTSPMVGTAYLAPDPASPPFVAVGSVVKEGDTVMIIEAMKVMNSITAHRPGTVQDILVASGQPVEFGQPLMVIA